MMKISFTVVLVLFALASSLIFGLSIFQKISLPTALVLTGVAAGILFVKTFELND